MHVKLMDLFAYCICCRGGGGLHVAQLAGACSDARLCVELPVFAKHSPNTSNDTNGIELTTIRTKI